MSAALSIGCIGDLIQKFDTSIELLHTKGQASLHPICPDDLYIPLMSTNEWIRAARKHAKLTQDQLAEKLEMSKGNVSGWENGRHKPSFEQMKRVAALTGLPLPLEGAVNTEPGPSLRGKVPLISWVQAGEWCDVADPHLPGQADRWMDCPVNHSASTFVLKVRGDSMTAPSGNSRTYPEGCYIFVDPERRNPVNGDRVVACMDGTDEVTFKIYKNEDGRQWLQPLNPSHEPIRESFHILGTVLGKWEDG